MTKFAHLPNMHLLATARLFENGIVAGHVPAYVVCLPSAWPQLVSLNLQSGVLPVWDIVAGSICHHILPHGVSC